MVKLLFPLLLWPGLVFSQGVDRDKQANEEAFRKTQELLRSKSQREANLGKEGTKVDANLKEMTGNDEKLTNEVYGLAAEVFGIIMKESGGDGKKMQELLQEYQKNPESFAAKFSPEQRAKLKEISERMPARAGAPR